MISLLLAVDGNGRSKEWIYVGQKKKSKPGIR